MPSIGCRADGRASSFPHQFTPFLIPLNPDYRASIIEFHIIRAFPNTDNSRSKDAPLNIRFFIGLITMRTEDQMALPPNLR